MFPPAMCESVNITKQKMWGPQFNGVQENNFNLSLTNPFKAKTI